MRKISMVALMGLVIVLLAGCKKSGKLQMAVEKGNASCPISMGPVGECESIAYEDGEVIYTLALNEQFMSIDKMKANPDMMKQALMANYANPQGDLKKLKDLAVEENAGIRYVYKSKASGETFDVLLTPEELKAAAENTDVTPDDKLNKEIEATNIQLPMQVDQATVLERLQVEGSNVVYVYTVDESVASISNMQNDIENFKQILLNNLRNGGIAVKGFLEKVTGADKDLLYRYVGKQSGEKCEVLFSKSELKNLF